MERSEFDHELHTGLEESMHQLRLGGVGGGGGEGGELYYPERPGEPDCIYYMRNGSCGYGVRCRFNHPLDRAGMGYGGVRAGGGNFPERPGQPVCQHYTRTGDCRYGSFCKYHHPRDAAAVLLNHYGYPLRSGEKECSYYMKNGQCKFGLTCKFNHPQSNAQASSLASIPAAVQGPPTVNQSVMYPTIPHHAEPSQQFGGEGGGWQVARPPMVPSSYIQGPYGPMLFPGGVVPVAGWSPYTASVSALPPPLAHTNVGAGQLYGMPPMTPPVPMYYGTYPPISSSAGPSSSLQVEPSHPERQGQPACQHYLRTGECKYGSFCRYNHPTELRSQKASFALTPMGLPLRPDAPTCIYFMQHGVCKFGPTCKFNHPMGSLSYSPSASSLSDMPVAPYPVGSQTATLAPSTSSSDLRMDAVSGSKDFHTETSSSPSNPGNASGQWR